MTNPTILVTGAAGFIGFHTSKLLLTEGYQVLGIDNLNDYYDPALKQARLAELRKLNHFEFRELDIGDTPVVQRLFSDATFAKVVHLAAQAGVRYSLKNPYSYGHSNLTGFLNILEGCRQQNVEHLVYASSSSVYGANEKVPFSEQDAVDHPVSLYAATKKANEVMAHSYAHLYRLPVTGLRFFTVYGPWGRPDMAMYIFTKAILEGKEIQLFNYGEMSRDFTYIDDIVEGVFRTMEQPASPDPTFSRAEPNPGSSNAPYRVYNIGNHQPLPLAELVSTLEDALGVKAKTKMCEMQPGDVPTTYADTRALQEAVGFSPSTTLKMGIEKFVAWFRDFYNYPVELSC
jgi:UDP-glucuronate 4-epimerase